MKAGISSEEDWDGYEDDDDKDKDEDEGDDNDDDYNAWTDEDWNQDYDDE